MRTLVTTTVTFATVLMVLGWAAADSSTVKWEDVVGILQASNAVGSGSGQITGGGQPWTTQSGKAEVDLRTGRVKFTVRGLVLAGGNGIGTTGGIPTVKGTLVCDTDGSAGGGNSVLVDTDLVPLSPQGDADFSGTVTIAPACQSQSDIAFVVRIAAGRWIANGSVRIP